VLDTLDFHIGTGARVVLLDGPEGFGRTVSLAQYAARNAKRSVALFLRPQDTLLCHPDALRSDFQRQVRALLGEDDAELATDDGLIRSLLLRLHRRSRRNETPALFIVDGLDELPEDSLIRAAIVPLLYLDSRDFAFVFSAAPGGVPLQLPTSVVEHRVGLQVMSKEDVRLVFRAVDLSDEQLETIKTVTRGIPVKVGTVRRLLERGATVEQVLSEAPVGDVNFFESEWREIERGSDNNDHKILALIAIDIRSRTVSELSALVGLPVQETRERIDRFPFLFRDPESEAIRFEADAFRRFVQGKLENYAGDAYELLVGELSRDATSQTSLTLLPDLLAQSNKLEELLAFLSPEQFSRLIGISESLAVLRRRAHLGVTAADTLHRDPDLLRFGLQESAIAAIEIEPASRSAIEALLAVQDYERALLLAQRSPNKEDRLQLMSIVATAKRKTVSVPDTALESEIRRLSGEIDPAVLGRKAVEIAADVVAFSPALALDFVERATREAGTHGDMDWALARVSLAWSLKKSANADGDRIDDKLQQRIVDPVLRRFTASVAAAVEGSTASRILTEVERFHEPEERIYFLRNWLTHNADRSDGGRISEALLAMAVETTGFTITADLLRDTAQPLAKTADADCVRRCIAVIDSMKGTVAARSRALHLLELELALAEAEASVADGHMQDRLDAVYNTVVATPDPTEKCDGLALALATLSRIAPDAPKREERVTMTELVRLQLTADVDSLLLSVADHYRAVRQIVRFLSTAEPDLAADIASRLNTLERRDACLRDVLIHHLSKPAADIPFPWVLGRARLIQTDSLREQVVVEICDVVRRSKPGSVHAGSLMGIAELAETLSDSTAWFHAVCGLAAYGVSTADATARQLADHLTTSIILRLDEIDKVPARVDAGYEGAAYLADGAASVAQSLLSAADARERSTPLAGRIPSAAYEDMLRLAIRAFGGILQQGLESDNAERALEALIHRVPASGDQAILWSHVAAQHIRHKRTDRANEIVRRYVRPLIESIPKTDKAARWNAISEALPALFVANKTLTREQLGAMPKEKRNDGVETLCNYLLRGITPSDSFEVIHGKAPDVDYDVLVDVCDLLSLSDSDTSIWNFCDVIANTATASSQKRPLTSQQRADIARRLRSVVKAKLPHPDGIQHDGPAILSEAHIARIEDAKGDIWSDLVDRARRIDNIADRALVLSLVADALPKKEKVGRTQVISDSFAAAEAMPTCIDKVERLAGFADALYTRDPDMAKRALRRASAVARELRSEDGERPIGRILDVAYRVDENLAQDLAKEFDDDPGRKEARKRAKARVRVLDVKKRIGTGSLRGKIGTESPESIRAADYVRAADMALGALNAGLKRPLGISALREGGPVAASLSLDKARPLYVWIIENLARHPERSEEARAAVTALFQATVTAADLTFRLVDRTAGERRVAVEQLEGPRISGLVAGADERDKVFEFIRNWCVEQDPKVITVCDPYFGPAELDMIELISWALPNVSFKIITAIGHQDREGVAQPYKESYRRAWRSITDRDAPFADVTLIGEVGTGKSPIHDRWILAHNSGLTLGTSANSIGRTKLSQVRQLGPDEASEVLRRLEPVLLRSARVFENYRVEFESFLL